MATFFSLYTSSSLILLLLSLTTAGLFLRSDAAAALAEICGKTKQPPRCRSLLKSTDTRSQTAAIPELGQIAITAATDAAGAFKIKIHSLMVSARDSKLKSLYRNCENLYLDALDQLFIAPVYLQKRRYGKLKAAAGDVRGAARGCAAAAVKNAGLRAGIEDTRVLADAIAVVAKKLSV